MKLKSKKPFLALILIAVFAFFVSMSYLHVSKMIEEECMERLFSSATITERIMAEALDQNFKILDKIAVLLSDYDNYDTLDGFKIFENFSSILKSDRIHLLLPNGDVFNDSGILSNISEYIDFKQEASHGRHISPRKDSIVNENEQIIRQFVPVEKNGEIVAILYATIACSNFSELIDTEISGYKKVHFFIVERGTGNFVYDSKHPVLGNTSDYRNRSIPNDISYIKVTEAIAEGKKGYARVFTDDGKRYNFMAYLPSSINDWSFVITVPENEVSRRLRNYHIQLASFCFIGLLLFIFYLYMCDRENKAKKKADLAVHEGLLKRNEEIIAALSNDYGSIFYINLDADKIVPYRMNKNEIKKYEEISKGKINNYEDFLKLYTTYCVDQNDKMNVLFFCSAEQLRNNLLKRKSISVRYLSVNDCYYEMKFSVADMEDNHLKSVVLGIAEKDYEIRKEMKKQQQ